MSWCLAPVIAVLSGAHILIGVGGRGLMASQHAIHHEPVADVTDIRYALANFRQCD